MVKSYEKSNSIGLNRAFSTPSHHQQGTLGAVMQTIVEGGMWVATASLPITMAAASVLGR